VTLRLFISRITLVLSIGFLASCMATTETDEDGAVKLTIVQTDPAAPPVPDALDPIATGPLTPGPDPITTGPVTPDPITPDPVTPDPEVPDPETPDPVIPVPNIPKSIAYNGWSTMQNGLSDQNTESSWSPSASHDPSLFNLVGEMYRANELTGYSSDFSFLPQGSYYIDGSAALSNINTTSASVIMLSAYGGQSGILQEPSNAAAYNGWINRMVKAGQAAQSRGIRPIMFQAWGSSGTEGTFHHAKINSDALQEKLGILVVRTGEIIDALSQLGEGYSTNSNSPGGKYAPPVLHLYSGDTGDNFHGSYAMAYANALATFKCLTGISAANNAFVIPSGGAAGIQYGMSQTFINHIIQTVDNIQVESLITGLAEGAIPIANNFPISANQGIESLINITTASGLLDDKAIVLDNFTLKSFDNSHFSSIELNQNQLIFTPFNSFTGSTTVVISYLDTQEQQIDIELTINVTD
jgi:hypothetical protein